MSTSQGLTSLRGDKLSPTATPQISPSDKDNARLAETRGEIERLERQRSDLARDVEKLNRASELTKERLRSDTEVKRLKIQRDLLIKQINELVEALNLLKDTKDKVVSAFGQYGEEQMGVLDAVARSLRVDIAKEMGELSEKSSELSEESELLSEFAQYFQELGNICTAESLSLALERTNLEKDGKALALQEESVKLAHNKTKELLSKAEALVWGADNRYQDADSIASFFEKQADKERKVIKNLAKDILLREKAIIVQKEYLKIEEKRLLELKRLIEDKDEALNRKAKELKLVI